MGWFLAGTEAGDALGFVLNFYLGRLSLVRYNQVHAVRHILCALPEADNIADVVFLHGHFDLFTGLGRLPRQILNHACNVGDATFPLGLFRVKQHLQIGVLCPAALGFKTETRLGGCLL